MQYDPIKRKLGNIFNSAPWLRVCFYRMLNILLLRTWHIRKELKKWRKDNPGPIQALDAGSGYGQYTHFLTRVFPKSHVKAIDLKEEQVADCNTFFHNIHKDKQAKFEVADLTNFQEKEKYDLILSVDVMEHIEDDQGVFKNLYQALKPGGLLLISTPSDQGGSDVHGEGDSSFIEEHVRDGYSIKDIENKLHDAGFTRIDSRYSYGTPGKISWKLSMKWPIKMLNASKIFYLVLPIYYLLTFPFFYTLDWLDVSRRHSTGTGLIVKAYKE